MRRTASTALLLALAACVRVPVTPAPEPVPGPPSDGLPGSPNAVEADVPESESADVAYLDSRGLVVPVAGAGADALHDTFSAPRDGGRHHHAIDILAPRGTPVLSADDGRILRLSTNALGGITVYAVDPSGRLVYYYAHLDHYHHGLTAGMTLARGDTLGYVGTTGNAPPDTPHLHFQIMLMPKDGKYWYGDPIDPYPVLLAGARAAAAQRAGNAADQP